MHYKTHRKVLSKIPSYDIHNETMLHMLQEYTNWAVYSKTCEDTIEELTRDPIRFLRIAIRARRWDCKHNCASHFDGMCWRLHQIYHLERTLNQFYNVSNNLHLYLLDKWKEMIFEVSMSSIK